MKIKFNWLDRLDNFTQRFIAAIVGVSVLISCITYGPWTYYAVFSLITMFTLLEFYNLVRLDRKLPLQMYGTLVGQVIFTISFLGQQGLVNEEVYFLLFPAISTFFIVKLYKKDKKPFSQIAHTILGIAYIAIPFTLLNYSVFIFGYYCYEIIATILLFHWANDTGAYFAGKHLGKHLLFERISPKKTWEGVAGGGVTIFLIWLVVSHTFDVLKPWQWAVLGIIIWVTGTYGDLVESMFKRSIAIKNSGEAIPGHGGFMDRFDGFLFSLPFIAAYLKIISVF